MDNVIQQGLLQLTMGPKVAVTSDGYRPPKAGCQFIEFTVARTGTIACSSIEKKQADWLSLILVAKKLNLIQLPELTARSPVNDLFRRIRPRDQAMGYLGMRSLKSKVKRSVYWRKRGQFWKLNQVQLFSRPESATANQIACFQC